MKILTIKPTTYLCAGMFSDDAVGKVKFEKGVKKIPFATFSRNEHIYDVEFNDELEEIEEKAFYRNISLDSVVLPENIKRIGKEAFFQCSALEVVACSEEMFQKRDIWLAGNPGTLTIVIYNTQKNYAKEVVVNNVRSYWDPEGMKMHENSLKKIKEKLRKKGITSPIRRTRIKDFELELDC